MCALVNNREAIFSSLGRNPIADMRDRLFTDDGGAAAIFREDAGAFSPRAGRRDSCSNICALLRPQDPHQW